MGGSYGPFRIGLSITASATAPPYEPERRFTYGCGAPRLAGSLVLLYGQPVRRLAALRRSDVTTHDGRTTVSLGSEALLLAPPLDRLTRELAAFGAPDPALVGLAQSFPLGQDWLFPGRRAGQPIGDKGLSRRLTKLGIPVRGARNSALLELAREVPP